MIPLAHSGGGSGWGGPFEPWEFHPALNHLPIAFLLGAVALDLYAWGRPRPDLARPATGLLVAGVLTGLLTAVAGVISLLTVPGHTEEAHRLMYWHLAIQMAALALFTWPACERLQNRAAPPTVTGRLVACLATVLLLIGSALGGYIVYHGGAGVEPELLAPELRHGHSPEGGAPDSPSPKPPGESHEHGRPE